MPPMLLILLGPICLTVALLAIFLPYGSFRVAARNGKVGSERSSRRTRREGRHLKRFLRNAVLLPVLIVVMIQGALFTLHYFIVPDTTMNDIFGEYHPDVTLNAPDLESWKTAMERSRRAREVEAELKSGGLTNQSKVSLAATMVEHWPLHIVFPLLPLAFLAWFMTRHFLAMSQRYHYEVTRRAKRYALHTAAAGAKAHGGHSGYASPPGMLNENFG